jgi:flagellar biosynthesis/type III secretory pathway M-ring protein FliF/YscJ
MTAIWIVVAIVVLAIIVGLIVMMMRKRREAKLEAQRTRAAELRGTALDHGPGVAEARHRAAEAEAEAQRARDEADLASRSLAQEEAHQEHALREADRLDPDVDERSDGYRPTTPAGPALPPESTDEETPGTHRRV